MSFPQALMNDTSVTYIKNIKCNICTLMSRGEQSTASMRKKPTLNRDQIPAATVEEYAQAREHMNLYGEKKTLLGPLCLH